MLLIIGPAFILGVGILRGFVLSTLWGWFVVPALGVPALGVVEAIGISLLAGYFLPSHNKVELGAENFLPIGLTVLVNSLLALGWGWVIQLFL